MRLVLLAVPLLVLLGCGGEDDDEGTGTVGTVTETSGDPTPTTTPPSTTGRPLVPATDQPVLQSTVPLQPSPPPSGPPSADEIAAIADLAAREGVDPSAITTVSVEEVTWRDSAIGCPEQGMNYMQVLSDGVRIVLELDGTSYQYHSGGGRPVFYCANPQPPVGE